MRTTERRSTSTTGTYEGYDDDAGVVNNARLLCLPAPSYEQNGPRGTNCKSSIKTSGILPECPDHDITIARCWESSGAVVN